MRNVVSDSRNDLVLIFFFAILRKKIYFCYYVRLASLNFSQTHKTALDMIGTSAQ